ncbi:MAG: family N-acetyltransferase [Caulobacter sp.]|nr:family N-acetyltransferase [Caulobacter sp.]
MLLHAATDADLEAVADLVNSAYRGESSRAGWTTEADYLTGQRTDADALRRDRAASPEAAILTLREVEDGPLLASVWVEPAGGDVWYLGMLTVRPDLQTAGLGRALIDIVESYARARGGKRLKMTVVHIRDTLIAWYERRGFHLTGAEEPFPHGEEFGIPLRGDLKFVVMEKSL